MTKRRMECSVCGADAGRWQQHWNRDTGYGVCLHCIAWLRDRGMPETGILDLYGKEGVNWGPVVDDSNVPDYLRPARGEENPPGWREVDGVKLPLITWAEEDKS
jgi:hypothetical protein